MLGSLRERARSQALERPARGVPHVTLFLTLACVPHCPVDQAEKARDQAAAMAREENSPLQRKEPQRCPRGVFEVSACGSNSAPAPVPA
eukprot:CAMPEP_0175996422 /NCGR_PEP_ID=MMETSP0108-20121206/55664_1 /TAXON_ID=195067 ORGANISM="Goniomonas pacifica, Strain CCMP1869" /NCGR_SAMPLE_ID=MMETSP0108 /ASSEMBLY_ACC=CAM_ASM_000204 /LENGTH=88 /DNA_ID=CAMNT_0017328625 /DNA_START=162 /DNA_END=428 /DNA_ORIENTATION=-